MREARQTRKPGINQQRRDHGFDAAQLVTHHPENNSPGRPAQNHRRRRIADILFNFGQGRGIILQQFFQSGFAGEDEQPLIHAIEKPAEGGDDHHQPVIRSHSVENTFAFGFFGKCLGLHYGLEVDWGK